VLQDTAKPCTAVILPLHGFNYHQLAPVLPSTWLHMQYHTFTPHHDCVASYPCTSFSYF